jgi:hypothetical protein
MRCRFLQDTECVLMKKLSGNPSLDCWVSPKDCNSCKSTSAPMMVNRFTVCTALSKLKAQSKFSIVQHCELVHAAQCTLGTGTILHSYLRWFQTAECGCEHKVNLMNTWGPNECAIQFDTIIGWLKEASCLMKIKFVQDATEALLTHCVTESQKLHKEFKLEWMYNV